MGRYQFSMGWPDPKKRPINNIVDSAQKCLGARCARCATVASPALLAPKTLFQHGLLTKLHFLYKKRTSSFTLTLGP